MKPDCRSFRIRLESTLEGARAQSELTSLAWHEHLLACAECRALLLAFFESQLGRPSTAWEDIKLPKD